MRTIQRRMATGIVWMVMARLTDRGIGVVSTLILARLLVPADFGLVAMAVAIGGVLDLLSSFSFDLALIQNKDAKSDHYDTVWTFNVLMGAFCAVVLAVLAIPASVFYKEPRLEPIMYAFSCVYLLIGFSNVGVVNFRKDLNFRDEFKFIMIRRVAAFIVTIGLALWLKSYWALIAGTFISGVISVYLSFAMSSYRPSFTLSAWRELFNFSKWMFVNNVLYFLQHSGPNFLIGRISGAAALGIYTVAYEISNLPSSELVAPINRATFPGFAKLDVPGIASVYLQVLGMTALLILPVGIGIATVAEPLVLVALGETWREAAPLIALLALYGALAAMLTSNVTVWIALGRPRDVTIVGIASVALLIGTLVPLLGKYGTVGAGYAYLLSQCAIAPVSVWNTKRLLLFKWRSFASALWRPLFGVAVMYFLVREIDARSYADGVGRLAIDVIGGALCYMGTVLASWFAVGQPPGAEQFCLKQVFRFTR